MTPPQTADEFFAWYRSEHGTLHEAWSAAVGTFGYDKGHWLRRERELNDEARIHASRLRIEPPFYR